MAILPNVTTALVGGRRTTGAHQHLQDATHTHRARRKRRLGANRTSDSAAAPGAAGVHPLPPETEAPARQSPHTIDRTTPERGTVQTAPTPTAGLAAALAATHPFAKGEEIHPASWRRAGSPAPGSGRSRTTDPVPRRPATTAAPRGPVAAVAAATAATVAAEATAAATTEATAGAGVEAGAGAGAGVAAGAAPAATTVTTAAAATTAPASERNAAQKGKQKNKQRRSSKLLCSGSVIMYF